MKKRLHFFSQTVDLLTSMSDARAFQTFTGVEVQEDVLGEFREMLRQMITFYQSVGATAPWTGFVTVDGTASKLVGVCSFKGNPDADNAVEIAYYTHPSEEGKGYASEAALYLVDFARQHDPSIRIFAHTLPERNASCRILEKAGFSWTGAVEDPEDGTIWRWDYNGPEQESGNPSARGPMDHG